MYIYLVHIGKTIIATMSDKTQHSLDVPVVLRRLQNIF